MDVDKTFGIKQLVFGIVFVVVVFCIGVLGYKLIEDYELIDAIYMSVMTVSTVGFGEVAPLSDSGKLFTSILIIFSIGGIGYVLTSLTRLFLNGYFRMTIKGYNVKKKIERLQGHVIVCGYGRNGYQACQELADHEQPFIIIDKRENVINKVKANDNLLFIQGNASSEEVLTQARIQHAKALITALPNDADNIFVVLTAREMNPSLKIISRASNFRSDLKLKRAGADNIIMPDRIGGQRMAKLVVEEDIVEFMEYIMMQSCHSVTVKKVSCTNMCPELEGKSLKDLKLRSLSGAHIIGLKDVHGMYVFNPDSGYQLERDLEIFVFGSADQVKALKAHIEGGYK